MGEVCSVVLGSILLGHCVCVYGQTRMVGLILFLAFWAVFAVVYISRDQTQDAEKLRQCDLW